MSLINQMLQDLDARRTDAGGGGSFGQQIRAVPEHRSIHPAWWVASALAVVLSGLLVWLMLRTPAPDPASRASAQLPLKLDIGLNTVPQTVQVPATPEKMAETAAPEPAPVTADKPNEAAPPALARRDEAMPQDKMVPAPAPNDKKPVQPEKPVVTARAVKEAPVPVPELAKIVPATKALAPATVAKTPEPVAINKQVKELTPQQRAENEYRKAVLAMQQGRSSEAVSGLEQVLQLDVQHAAARQTLIGALLENKRHEEALRRAREGLNIDSAQPGLAMILARLQLEKGELRAAIETLERTLSYASDRADYQAFLAALLQRDDRHKQATEYYLQALQRAPQNGVWWMGLGISLQAEHRKPEAQEAFKRAKATNTLSSELLAFVDARLSQLQR